MTRGEDAAAAVGTRERLPDRLSEHAAEVLLHVAVEAVLERRADVVPAIRIVDARTEREIGTGSLGERYQRLPRRPTEAAG